MYCHYCTLKGGYPFFREFLALCHLISNFTFYAKIGENMELDLNMVFLDLFLLWQINCCLIWVFNFEAYPLSLCNNAVVL